MFLIADVTSHASWQEANTQSDKLTKQLETRDSAISKAEADREAIRQELLRWKARMDSQLEQVKVTYQQQLAEERQGKVSVQGL